MSGRGSSQPTPPSLLWIGVMIGLIGGSLVGFCLLA
jgi:hypothetical protein